MSHSRRTILAGAAAAWASGPGKPLLADPAEPPALDLAEGSVRLRPDGPETKLLRYGTTPPILRVRQDPAARLRLRNGLPVATSLQICGLREVGQLEPAEMVSGVAVAPGAEAALPFTPGEGGLATVRPRFDRSGQARRGAAGVLIVDPAAAPPVDHDLVVLLQDFRLDGDNRLIPPDAQDGGTPAIAVNAQAIPVPWILRPGARVRLRLVSASVDRVMVVTIEGAKAMIVGIDGQPSKLFQPNRDTVPIGPGARFELMLDLPREPGKAVRVVGRRTERIAGTPEGDRILAVLTTDGAPLEARAPITGLPINPALPVKIPLETSKRAELTIASDGGGWTVNGVSGRTMPKAPILRAKAGDAVTLGFSNASPMLVPLSLYGQAVRLLHPNDDGWEPYWRDTVLLPPGSRNHVAFIAAKPGRWPIEAGFESQAVAGLRCWLEVLG